MMQKFPLLNRESLSGLLDRFYLLGPFNAEGRISSCKALRKDYLGKWGGETAVDAERFRRAAVPYVIGAGIKVNLIPMAPNSGSIMYALAFLDSAREQAAIFRLGSDKGYKLFLNNREIGYLDEHRGLAPDQNAHAVRLRRGTNIVLMKIEKNFGGYEFTLRIEAAGKVVQHFDLPAGYPAETLRFDENGSHPCDFTGRLRYSGIEYLSSLAEAIRPALACRARNRQELARWRSALRRKFRELMGPEPARQPRAPLVLSSENIGDGLVREKIAIRVYKNSDIPCYLLRPRKPKGKYPCMLALHGHGGAYRVAGVTFGTQMLRDSIAGGNADFGLKFAKAGFIVICPTARGFGERGTEFPHACDQFALKASLMGMNLLAMNLYDFMRCLDYLHGLPFVDTRRTGCVGQSNGGTFTLHLAAIDTRIRAAIVAGAVGSWREQMWHSYACGNQFLHGMLQYADIADITALIAPRYLCIESGLYDSCFMSSSARKAHATIRHAYRVAGCPDRLCIDAFPGPHRFHGVKSIPFIVEKLAKGKA